MKQKLKILIIEDQQVFRNLALQVFEGCEKLSAANAADGFARFKEFTPDITLLDIGLPDKSGLDLLEDLIGYNPEAFIVMLTQSSVERDVKLARQRGAAGYITKPFTMKKVEQCIGNYNEYIRKLQSLSSHERANNLIKNLKIEALDKNVEEEVRSLKEVVEEDDKLHKLIKNWSILFVDNLVENRVRAKQQLIKLKCRIDVAGNKKEIEESIKKVNYNMIFLDASLKDCDAYDLSLQVKQNFKDTIIIGLIEKSDDIANGKWKKAKMDGYVKKPTRFAELREMIELHAKQEVRESS